MALVRCTLLFFQRDKENDPSSLNGTALPTRRPRDTSKNPYSKSYCKPLQNNPRPSSAKAPTYRPSTAKATTNAFTASQINKDSPTIK